MSTVLRKLGVEVDLSGDGNEELRAWIKNLAEARGQGVSMAGGLNAMEREMVEAAQKIGLTRNQLKELTAYASKSRDIKEFADRYGLSMSQVEQQTRQTRETISGLGSAVQAIAAAGIGARLLGAGREMVSLAAQYESTSVSFEVMLGSADRARQVLQSLTEFSNVTPYEPTEVMAAGRSLLAFGFQQQELIGIMRTVGDVASGVGMNFNELAQIVGKNKTQGKVQTEDLMQFAGRGIPIYEELAKVFNTTSSHVRDLASSGSINFSHLQRAFQNMTSQGGKYFGMMDRQSRTAIGLWSTLSGNIDEVKRSFGQTLLDGLKPLLDLMVKGTGWVLEHKGAMITLKVILLLLIPIIGTLLVGAMYSAAVAAWTMAAGVIAATWPFILIAAAIMAIILVIQDLYVWFTGGQSLIGSWLGPWRDNINKIKGYFSAFWNGIRSMFLGIYGFFREYGRYIIMAIFPVSILYFYWDQISGFLRSIPGRIVEFFQSIPDRILSALSGLKERMKSYLSELLPAWAVKLVARVSGNGEQQGAVEARASGGPVRVGREYWVGEHGPERFTPDTNGTIIPNGAGTPEASTGPRITFAPVITITGASENDGRSIAESVERVLRDMIPSFLASLGLEVS